MNEGEKRILHVHRIFESIWTVLQGENFSVNDSIQLAYELVEELAVCMGKKNGNSLDENFDLIFRQIRGWREITLKVLDEARNEGERTGAYESASAQTRSLTSIEYLGDGVGVQFDRVLFIGKTDDGEKMFNKIRIEDRIYKALVNYVSGLKNAPEYTHEHKQ